MPGDVTPYTGLIATEHATAPKFMATIAASCQPFADLVAVLNRVHHAYDLDHARGAQLDVLGRWIGLSREVGTPLASVWFSFDIAGLGFDQGVWFGPGVSIQGLTTLPDTLYRLALKAKIIANHWDGTIPGAYAAWKPLTDAEGIGFAIIDNQDMTMTSYLLGPNLSPLITALFENGCFDLRPAGVGIRTLEEAGPFFGLDEGNKVVAGLDDGAWFEAGE